jgi:hypothetical protein
LRDAPTVVKLLAFAAVVALAAIALIVLYPRANQPVHWLEWALAWQIVITLLSSFSFSHHIAVAMLLAATYGAAGAAANRLVVVATLLFLALPKTLPLFQDNYQQQCLALVLLLMAIVVARGQGRFVSKEPRHSAA